LGIKVQKTGRQRERERERVLIGRRFVKKRERFHAGGKEQTFVSEETPSEGNELPKNVSLGEAANNRHP
jgi:hypothetical protein